MADEIVVFVGGARAVAQVDTLTPGGTIEADDIFNVTIENNAGEEYTLSVAAGGTTAADVVDAIVAEAAALKTAGVAPWDEVTVADTGDTATITGDTAGVPFWASETTTEAGGGAQDAQTFAVATTTVCAGPSIYSTAENWKDGAIPVTGNIVHIDASVTTDIYGSDQNTVDLRGFTVHDGSTINIGGAGKALEISLKDTNYYNANLYGTGKIYLDIDDYGAINVFKAGAPTSAIPWALNLVGTHDASTAATGVINIMCGANESVSIAANPRDTEMEAQEIVITDKAVVAIGSVVTDYNDATFPLLEMAAGDVTVRCNTVTETMTGGSLRHSGTATLTTGNVYGGTLYYESSGTLTTANLGDAGALDCTRDLRTREITTCNRYGSAKIKDPFKTVTATGGGSWAVVLKEGKIDANLDLGNNMTITRS